MITAPLLICIFLAVVAAGPREAVGLDGYVPFIAEDGIITELPSTACIGDMIVIHGYAREQMLYKVEMVYLGADENLTGGSQQEAHLGTFEATGDWTFTFRIPETLSIKDSDQLTVPTPEGKYIVGYYGNSAHINSGAGGTFHVVTCSSLSPNLPDTGAPFWLLLSGLPLTASGLGVVLKRRA